MGFWDFLKSPDTVASLTSEVQGFLATFSTLSEKCTDMLVVKEVEMVAEHDINRQNLNSAKELYDMTVTSENTRHAEEHLTIEKDIDALTQNIEIANKITSFFED